jgi:hypothetical protein
MIARIRVRSARRHRNRERVGRDCRERVGRDHGVSGDGHLDPSPVPPRSEEEEAPLTSSASAPRRLLPAATAARGGLIFPFSCLPTIPTLTTTTDATHPTHQDS